ncbi:MAG: TolC family protein [Cyanobacteriota bacterium]
MFKKFYIIVLSLILITSTNTVLANESKEGPPQNELIKVNISTSEDVEPVTLSLCKALELAKANNLNIAIKKDQVEENKLKLDEVKNKRLFLFFKFVNSGALQKSAKYSIEASTSSLRTTENNVLAESSAKYFNLLQTLLTKQVAKDFLKRGENSLIETKKLLEEGHATKFDVKQTEVFVEGLKQKLLEAEIAYMLSSVDIAQYINAKVFNTNIIPEECQYNAKDSKDINIKILNLIPDDLLLNDSVDYALKHRPELEELNCKIKSLEELIIATKNDDIKVKTLESQISQLHNTYNLTQNGIKTTVTKSLLQVIGAKNQIDVAQNKYNLSIKALEQAKMARIEGFSANKDILDAHVNLATSKNDYYKAIISYNIAQINLLKELGLIDIAILNDNKTIELPSIVSENLNGFEDPVKTLNKNILDITEHAKDINKE